MNVVVVILDSLRRDHVGAYGNDWIKTPSLDALAKDSMRFTRPYPESIPTICARRAIYTGKRTWPFRGWEPPRGETIFSPAGWSKIPEEQASLTTILSENGYETALITDTFHQFKPTYNFQQSFDVFEQVRGQATDAYRLPQVVSDREVDRYATSGNDILSREKIRQHLANVAGREGEEEWFAPRVFSRAMEYLDTAKDSAGPFFLMVDNFDPHEPWDPPEPYKSMYGDPINGYEPVLPNYGEGSYLTKRELERTRQLYAGEVTMTDRWLGEFLNKLEDLGLAEETLLLTLSDHGVALGEHGYMGKVPEALWPEITDIVYYVRHPEGKGAGRTSDFYASTHDITPTILGALGQENLKNTDGLWRIQSQIEGQDLTAILEGGSPRKERPYFTLGYDNYSWARDERYAMFCYNDRTGAKLYDLRQDPEMNDNIAGKNSGMVRRMYDDYIVADAGGEPPPIR